ncbi:hypothetical protein [uncultured Mobiluncus sp.]|uniref:RCC1 domain-containing protein n=1 Tax=uncultured Mobiluncus sp. TaxID=293425 RepID=UPI00260AF340|nr:hypothetical protein [uncultured Mobiluncus sp.]
MKHLSGLKLTLLSVLAVFVVSGGGLATVTAWQDTLTVGDATITSGDGWGGHKFTQIAAERHITYAIDTTGQAWGWGNNYSGYLGVGLADKKILVPQKIVGEHKFKQIFTRGALAFAIDKNDGAWAWGNNYFAQLGDGTTTNRNTPVKVADGHKFTQISIGAYHVVAIDTDGQAWAWGANGYGRLGNGKANGRELTPIKVADGHKFTQVTAGAGWTLAIDTDGDAWAWGNNETGQLGDGTTTDRHTPVKVSGGHKFKQISTAGDFAAYGPVVAIDTDGDAWAWGDNYGDKLGIGTPNGATPIPHKVKGGHEFKQISASYGHTVALDTNGDAWAWGSNDAGEIGIGYDSGYRNDTPNKVRGGHKFVQIVAADQYTVALDVTGQAWAWGDNQAGQLGDGTTTSRREPVKVLAQ